MKAQKTLSIPGCNAVWYFVIRKKMISMNTGSWEQENRTEETVEEVWEEF